mmetsp:Transcript_10356/g.30404  ORF Transcript_10356/g.30404 Transcript_10356/m.30404 type:complete len:242 (-) Transcript_10356:67-792(-)
MQTAPHPLVNRPSVPPGQKSDIAIKQQSRCSRSAPNLVVLATPPFLANRPLNLQVVGSNHAIICLRWCCAHATSLMVAAAPSLLDARPGLHPGVKARRTIERWWCHRGSSGQRRHWLRARTNEPRGEPQRENEREAHHQAADDRVGPVVAKHWHHLKLACPLTNIFPCCFLPVCTSSATCVREHLRRLKVIAASSSTTQPPSQPTKASRTNLVICSTHSGHVVPPSAFTIQHRHVSEHYAG